MLYTFYDIADTWTFKSILTTKMVGMTGTIPLARLALRYYNTTAFVLGIYYRSPKLLNLGTTVDGY